MTTAAGASGQEASGIAGAAVPPSSTGAERLLRAAVAAGVEVVFANPGAFF